MNNKELTVFAVYALEMSTFAIGGTVILGLIINLIWKNKTKDTWLYSHHMWQIKTCLFFILWLAISLVLIVPMTAGESSNIFTMLGIAGLVLFASNVLWYLYRIIRGFVSFRKKKPMYAKA